MTKPIDPQDLSDELEGVRRLARSLARDDHEADDLVQDTMVAALQNRTRIRSGLGAWLAGVARNLSRRTARSSSRRARHESEHAAADHAPSTADVIVRAAEQSRVLDTLVRMQEPYRSAVLLRYIEGLPPRAIARRLDLPVETVRTHIKRGLQRLREALTSAHGGHRGETRAALILAASETLGAGRARAVALARASGLVVLVLLGLVAVQAVRTEAPAADGPTYLSEAELRGQTTSDPADSAEADAGPVPAASERVTPPPSRPAQTPNTRAPHLESPAPDPEAPAPAGSLPETPVDPGTGEASPVVAPVPEPEAPRPLPVVPIEEKPAPIPRIAVEDDKRADEKPAAGGESETEDGAGEFYDGETNFSARQVDRAIGKGCAWLLKRQGRNGSWGGIRFNSTYGGEQTDSEGMPAGPTALALYALLKCKTEPDHPAVKRGFDWLSKHHRKPASSYETSMLLLAVTATADQDKLSATVRGRTQKPRLKGRYRSWASKLADHLIDKREGRGWRYNIERGATTPGGTEDLSSTQLAALALFAAERVGIKTKRSVWEDILAFSLEQQEPEGPEVTYRDPLDDKRTRTARARGFAYIRGATDPEERKARGGMTACGLANLEMARFILSDGGAKWDEFQKRSDAARIQTAIFDGLAWLDRHWSPFEDPHAEKKNVYHIYWLYALERAMDLLDLKLVGQHNWYNEMGQALLNRQHANGHWAVRTSGGGHDVLDTGFALLFLKRAMKGRIPFGSVTGGSMEPIDNR